jgi:hypothetical protein
MACWAVLLAGCGGGGDANDLKIGAECTSLIDCGVKDDGGSDKVECLTEFKGGYCGHKPCTTNADCPEKSVCATLETVNYCFLKCTDKPECNQNRTVDNESNCSATVKPVDGSEQKVCVPPSAGT